MSLEQPQLTRGRRGYGLFAELIKDWDNQPESAEYNDDTSKEYDNVFDNLSQLNIWPDKIHHDKRKSTIGAKNAKGLNEEKRFFEVTGSASEYIPDGKSSVSYVQKMLKQYSHNVNARGHLKKILLVEQEAERGVQEKNQQLAKETGRIMSGIEKLNGIRKSLEADAQNPKNMGVMVDQDVEQALKRVEQIKKEYEMKKQEEERLKREIEINKQKKLDEQRKAAEQRIAERLQKEKQEVAEKLKEGSAQSTSQLQSQSQVQPSVKTSQESVAPQASAPGLMNDVIVKTIEKYKAMYLDLKNNIQVKVTSDAFVKKYVFGHKKTITMKIGQLTNSKSQIASVVRIIDGCIEDSKKHSTTTYLWCLNLLAKALVKQAENEVSVKNSAAFPLAETAVSLMIRHKELVDMIYVRLYKKCPYIFPTDFEFSNKSKDEIKGVLGYKKTSSGWEAMPVYQERICGIFALYSAILQTISTEGVNPMPISNGWVWLSRTCNLRPLPISPALISVFLEICGTVMEYSYKPHFEKLVLLVKNHYIQTISTTNSTTVAAISRLETIINEYLSTKSFAMSEARLMKP